MIKESLTLLPCFYFVELPLLISSVVSVYFLEWTDVFRPVRWGFSCQDRSLSLPYIEPTHEVISSLMLLSLTFAAPALMIIIGEGILFCCLSRVQGRAGAEADINAAGCNFNSFVRRGVRFVGVHVFGLCATALITDIIQLWTGYPAPYFLTVCKPNYTHLNTSCDKSFFILEDICSGSDAAVINAGRKSFPSQHAALASFAAVYVSMYFNSTLTDSSKLLKPLLVFSFIMCAIICGLTRIIQHKNHAVDVYLGFLLGGAIAVYLGLFAVGNFQPSKEKQTAQLHIQDSHRTAADLCLQGHHLPATSCSDGLSSTCLKGILHRNTQHHRSESLRNLKRSDRGVEVISPRVPPLKENMVAFSNTLPRVHMPTLDETTLRSATLHTSSVDSSRSKQLLLQWKSKNENRMHSLHAMDGGMGRSSPNIMEVCCDSELPAVGMNGEHQRPGSPYLKLPTGSMTIPSNLSGIAGGTQMPVQTRSGSSPLVHFPDEMQENMGGLSKSNSSVRDKWLKSMERNAAEKAEVQVVRTNSNGQPRVMQVIAMSKQQSLIQGSFPSSDSDSHTSSTAPLQRYKSLGEKSGVQGSPGAIIRVEAHPENGRPLVHAHSTDGSVSWTWKPQSSCRQSLELNDLNRDSESSESGRDGNGTTDRKRNGCHTPKAVAVPTVPTVSTAAGGHHPNQMISTIRVTPLEMTEPGPESCDSSLRRKNSILIPEGANSPDSSRNIFYKGTSSTPSLNQ